jgi:hypothetical protein
VCVRIVVYPFAYQKQQQPNVGRWNADSFPAIFFGTTDAITATITRQLSGFSGIIGKTRPVLPAGTLVSNTAKLSMQG